MIRYTVATTPEEVRAILALQGANHSSVLSEAERQSQGYVTVQYDPEVLMRMSREYPQVIAKDGDIVAGYCLLLPQSFREQVPILAPMFERLDELSWQGRPLAGNLRWFVMGQVCVAEGYRGQGVFDGLYRHLAEVCRPLFDFVVTEVAAANRRSMRAHERVGFENLLVYDDPSTGETWHIIVLDISP